MNIMSGNLILGMVKRVWVAERMMNGNQSGILIDTYNILKCSDDQVPRCALVPALR